MALSPAVTVTRTETTASAGGASKSTTPALATLRTRAYGGAGTGAQVGIGPRGTSEGCNFKNKNKIKKSRSFDRGAPEPLWVVFRLTGLLPAAKAASTGLR